VIEFLVLSLPTFIYLLVRRRDPSARVTMGLTMPRPMGWLLGAALTLVSLGIGYVTTSAVPSEILHGPGTTGPITGVVAGLFVALRATGEEILFRGFIQGLIAKRFGPLVGIGVQGLLFLIPHLPLLSLSPRLGPLVLGQFAIGLALGWLRHHTSSIWPGTLAHIVTNVAAGLAF
jgi:membrane protease YdiL (CAAX protease family)